MKAADFLFFILATLFSVIFVIANLIGAKIIPLPFYSLAITSGTLVYPLTFVLSDFVTEIWGERRARSMVLVALSCNLVTYLVIKMLPLFSFETSSAVFDLSGFLFTGSLLAFFVSQYLDIRLFQKIKKLTNGRFLWLRAQIATFISQLLDTLIVNTIVLFIGLKMSLLSGLCVMGGNFLFKSLFSLLMIPFLYLAVKMTRLYVTKYETI